MGDFGYGSYPARLHRVIYADRIEMVVDVGFVHHLAHPFQLEQIEAPMLNDQNPVARARAVAARDWVVAWLNCRGKWPYRVLTSQTPKEYRKDLGRWQARIYKPGFEPGSEECLNDALVAAGHATIWRP